MKTFSGGGDAKHTMLRTAVPDPNMAPQSFVTHRPNDMQTQWSSAPATCNEEGWGPPSTLTEPPLQLATAHRGYCGWTAVTELLFGVIVSAAVWSAAVLLLLQLSGTELPFNLQPQLALPLFLAALLLYGCELRRREAFWSAAWPGSGNGEAFATRLQELRDAEPRVELCVPGERPSNYRIVEWRDETRPADPGSYFGTPKGLFLVFFPVEIYPGDPSEASALDFARAQSAAAAAGFEVQGPVYDEAAAEAVELRAHLRSVDGSEVEEPAPLVLVDGQEAECLRPVLFLSVPCLLGLVADSLLRILLKPLTWPIRKRIFTLQGAHLGLLRFVINRQGEVHFDGNEQGLRHANRFWLKDTDWRAIWAAVHELGDRVAALRRIRILSCSGAGVAMVLEAAIIVLLLCLGVELDSPVAKAPVAAVFLVMLVSFAAAGLAGWRAHRAAQSCAAALQERLQGAAKCQATWADKGPDLLAITVEQLASEKSALASRTPIGSSTGRSSSSSSSNITPGFSMRNALGQKARDPMLSPVKE